MNFPLFVSGSWHQKTHVSHFKFNWQNWNFSENRPVDPQFYIVGIFCCQIRVHEVSKLLRTKFGPFLCFGKIFGFFSNRPLHPYGFSWNFFLEKIGLHAEKPILPKFQLSSCYRNEIGPKSKKGETKKWKSVLGGR